MFFVIALAASSLVEIISQTFKLRSKDLENTLGQMLAGKPLSAPTRIEDLSVAERTLLSIPDDMIAGALAKPQIAQLAGLQKYRAGDTVASALAAFQGTSVYEAASAGARRGLKRGKPSYLAARSFADGVIAMLGDARTPGTVLTSEDFQMVPA